jgi:hypothetical protein
MARNIATGAELHRDKRRLFSMRKMTTIETVDGRKSVWPLLIAIAVAVFGLCTMLIVDHGIWDRQVESPLVIRYATTEDAAKAAQATVTPTTPKPALEPAEPGPKRVQPAIPENKSWVPNPAGTPLELARFVPDTYCYSSAMETPGSNYGVAQYAATPQQGVEDNMSGPELVHPRGHRAFPEACPQRCALTCASMAACPNSPASGRGFPNRRKTAKPFWNNPDTIFLKRRNRPDKNTRYERAINEGLGIMLYQPHREPYRIDRDQSDFAEIWRTAHHRRADDISSGIDTLKTLGLLSAAGLLLSMILALCGLDVNVDYF